MPEYSSTTITPADGVKVPAMNGGSSGNFQLDVLRNFILSSKGQANGLASLGADGKLTAAQLPDLADDVLVYGSYALLPSPGIAGKLYITADDNKMYRWDDALATPAYVELSVDLSAYATKAELAAEESAREAEDTDLKNALDANTKRIENLEEKAGDYVPVDSDKGVISVPSGKGKWAVVEKLRGVSRAENNILVNGNFASSNGWNANNATINSVSGNVLTFTASAQNGKIEPSGSYRPSLINGHVYLLVANVKTTSATTEVYLNDGFVNQPIISSTNWQTVATRVSWSATSGAWPYPAIVDKRTGSWDAIQCRDFFIRDLTLYFGSTVPTLAEIQNYYPWLLSPSAYGTSLVDSVYEGVKSVSPNIFDEQMELGTYSSVGVKATANDQLRSTNKIKVKPSTAYYFCVGYPAWLCFYDINQNFISGETNYGNASFTTPSNCQYVAFAMWSNYGTTYNGIQICDNSYTDKTTYHPHMESTLSLPTPITLRSAGSVAEEFDLETGEKTNPLATKDLSTLTWTYNTSLNGWWLSSAISDAKIVGSDGVPNWTCDKFNVMTGGNAITGNYPNAIGQNGSGQIICYNGSSSTAPSGTLYYELANPTTEQLEPIQNPTILTEADGTISAQTEEPIDGNFSVGFITL